MFISLQVLEQKEIQFREEYPPETIDLGPELRQSAALSCTGRATLIEERHGHKGAIQDIRVQGELATAVQVECARCLQPVIRDVQRRFELLYRPQGSDAGREEISVTDAEAEIGYYQGDGVELKDILREQILLEAPMKVICREECRGLCPHCGQNLNLGRCQCAEPGGDPRWEALKDLRDKLEH